VGSNQDNFQLHRFTTSENIAESFRGRGGYFLTRTVVVGGEVIKKETKTATREFDKSESG